MRTVQQKRDYGLAYYYRNKDTMNKRRIFRYKKYFYALDNEDGTVDVKWNKNEFDKNFFGRVRRIVRAEYTEMVKQGKVKLDQMFNDVI
jgi:sarcosine oxidase delta subunit